MTSRILLADDSITIQKVVNLTFADEGIEVIAVSNGEVAERRLSEICPDLVLADIFMPGKNGYELCEFVKQSAQFANVPVVLLVGAFEPFSEVEARRVRADAHLTKPFESRTLVETVRKLIGKNAGHHPPATLPPEADLPAPPFNLDLSSGAPEWPYDRDGQQSVPFGAPAERSTLEDALPLDLNYGSPAAADRGARNYQGGTEMLSSDTGFSFASSVRDTAELPPIEPFRPQASSGADSASDGLAFQDQIETSSIAVAEAEPLHAEPDRPGFQVKSTFGENDNVILDFEKLDAPTPPVPENIVSFDVDFSALGDAPPPEVPVVASGPTLPAAGGEYELDQIQPAHDSGFGLVEPAVHSLAMDDPLGDVLEVPAAPIAVVADSPVIDIGAFDFAETLAVEPASQIAAEVIPEIQAPLDGEADFSITDKPDGIVHSGLSFEAFSPVQLDEDLPKNGEPSVAGEPAQSFEIAADDASASMAEPPVSPVAGETPRVFASADMWSGEETQFTAIDIEAVAVEEALPASAFSRPIEGGFAFASVGIPATDESRHVAASTTPTGAALNLPPAVIDEIVRRLVAEIGDAVVREIAWEVVPDCVERVVAKLTLEAVSKRI